MRDPAKVFCVVAIVMTLALCSFGGTVTAEPRQGRDEVKMSAFSVVVDIVDLTHMNVTWTGTFEGKNASAMRALFDLDADGRVSTTEFDDYMDKVNDPLLPVDTKVNITLDNGEAAVRMRFSVEGAEGNVDSASPLKIMFLEQLQFPEPDPMATHAYGLGKANEFVGGDEPWENEFAGASHPWDNEFIGGDEPWESKVDVLFRAVAPDGWEFDPTDWPTGLSDHLSRDGTVISMRDEEVRSDYNRTFGSLDDLVIRPYGSVVCPKAIDYVVELEEVNLMTFTISAEYEGESADWMRNLLNYAEDTVIDATEVDRYLSIINEPLEVVDTEVAITLDGKGPDNVNMSFDLEGGEGSLTGGKPLTVIFTETIHFHPPAAAATHTYSFAGAEEFVGGDEPWENEFIGGDEPWENEFIGGDEPWENKIDLTFRLAAPPEWEFDLKDWPAGLIDYVSEDGTTIEMTDAQVRAGYNSTVAALDTLVIREGGPNVEIHPKRIEFLYAIESPDKLTMTISADFEGVSARELRQVMDVNRDDIVSSTEADDYLAFLNDPLEVIDTDVRITLGDRDVTGVEMSFSFDHAVGDVDSTSMLSISFVETVRFTLPEDRTWERHSINFEASHEWVGGDEPWDDEFVGGDEPWDNEFVGGDEPWDNRVDVLLRITCPDDWTFRTKGWPEGLRDFLSPDGTTIEMDGADITSHYDSTLGTLDNLDIKTEVKGDDNPGFGLFLAIVAAALAIALVQRRRRR